MDKLDLHIIFQVLVFPIKVIAVSLMAVFARIFHDNENPETAKEITATLVMTRTVMSMFILLMGFYLTREHFDFSENTSLLIAGGLAFSFREVMDTMLRLIKKPSQIKELFNTNEKSDTDEER